MNTVLVRSYHAPPISFDEILRYMGFRAADSAVQRLAEDAASACRGQLSYKVCYGIFPVCIDQERIQFPFAEAKSRALAKNLCGCSQAIVFAATIGLWPDRAVLRYARTEPSKALAVQALGAERIESLCNAFEADIKAEYEPQGLFIRPRFSPGYSDLDIALQRDIFRALDCPKKIGLTLNESMLMSPTKSVTAIIGLGAKHARQQASRCQTCTQKNCSFRSENHAT